VGNAGSRGRGHPDQKPEPRPSPQAARSKLYGQLGPFEWCDHNLTEYTDTPELPKGIVIRSQQKDRTEALTKRMPSLILERPVYKRYPEICPSPTPSTTSMLELRDYIQDRLGYPLLQTPNNLHETLMFEKPALRSILPRTNGQSRENGPDSHVISMHDRVYISEMHRLVLCAIGNNRAGLGNISAQELFQLLSMVSSLYIVRLYVFEASHLGLSMLQQLFKMSIEVGHVRMLASLLSSKVWRANFDINEQICEVKGQHYTPLERAAMLGDKGMIDVMLRYGADVHKAHACIHAERVNWCQNCDSSGALNCALLRGPKGHRLDSRIFHTLLESTDRVNFKTLQILMMQNEDKLLIAVLEKFAHTNQENWKADRKFGCIWQEFFHSIKQQLMAMKLLQIMRSLGIARNTGMLNAAARHGHENVVTEMLREKMTLDEESLCSAIKGENTELVLRFLKMGAPVNDNTRVQDEGPYSEAIRTGNETMIQMLVEHNALDRLDQWRPWFAAWKAAVTVCNKDILIMLLSRQDQIPAHHLGCALSKFAKLGDYQMAVELLGRGAELEAKSNESRYSARPPLIEAMETNNTPLVILFLESGANPNVHGFGYPSPIVRAVRSGSRAIVERRLTMEATLNSSGGVSAF
jgi:hypothetical protein